jgi:hypothetical protein
MIQASWPSGVTLKSRLITAGSGPFGIEVLTTKLERNRAFLAVSAEYLGVFPENARDLFTLDVELPRVHPFRRRCIHCQATLSTISEAQYGTAEVVIAIHKMRFIPVPHSGLHIAVSNHWTGGRRIQ